MMVSARAMIATELVREACEKHGASKASSVALGRCLMGALLLANGRDEGERVQLIVQGDGAVGNIIAEACADNTCRGLLGNPNADARSVPELIGVSDKSMLQVARTHPLWKRPYTGTIKLKSGEIAEDIVQYLALSEQTPASMGLNVEWDDEAGRVSHAEGWLVTLLPGFDSAVVGVVEANIAKFDSAELKGPRPEAICEHLMRELLGKCVLEEYPRFRCSCSTKNMMQSVMMLGRTEVLSILKDKEPVEGKCEFCNQEYSLTPDEIREYMNSEEGKKEMWQKVSGDDQASELMDTPSPGTASWG